MEIYQLRYFVYAAKYENITMAAQELNVSQPSISKAIQSLERELKKQSYFEKTGRSCVLTRDGYLLQERVVPLLEEIERLPLNSTIDRRRNCIRLNVLTGGLLVPELIREFREENPDVFFQVLDRRGNQVGCLHSKYTASVCVQQCSKINGKSHCVSRFIKIRG